MNDKKLRVLGIVDGKGSRYHQIQLPLKALEAQGLIELKLLSFDQIKESLVEAFSDIDIVYNNWFTPFSIDQLKAWRNEYGFKWINAFDETIQCETHSFYIQEWAELVKFSDFVSATNLLIADELGDFAENRMCLPNFLPIGEGQFVPKPLEKQFSGKLRIGIIGSWSHYQDWALLKPVINRLAANKEIAANCEFVISGYEKHKIWDDIVSLFTRKKNLKVTVLGGKPVDSYMELYDEIDVVLQPLVENQFNICKSALKINEGSIKGCVLIGSPLYMAKEINNFIGAVFPLDYEEAILKLMEEGQFERISKQVCENNSLLNDWNGRLKCTFEMFEKVME